MSTMSGNLRELPILDPWSPMSQWPSFRLMLELLRLLNLTSKRHVDSWCWSQLV
jgi:hypothetical protein